MIDFLKKMKRTVLRWLQSRRIRREARRAFAYDRQQFLQHAGALHLDRKSAAVAEIVMGYHVLEKGLTMPHRRLGFGRGAVLHLVNLISDFERRFGLTDAQVRHAVGVLRAYWDLHCETQHEMPRLGAFLAEHAALPAACEPHLSRNEFYKDRDASFPAFAASRHVVRHFSGLISRDRVASAVELALTAPSACNRQPARVHVIDDHQLRDRLFELQKGTRGFGQDADKVLVVTVDLSAIRWSWERHDAYVNGGIFVMNLCYALHYQKIAHCILHWSVPPEADRQAHELLGIPSNEALVQVLACGEAPEEFDVAASPRVSLAHVMTWHGNDEQGSVVK